MKKVLIGFAGFIGVLLIATVIVGGNMWSTRNTMVAMEEKVKAQYVSNQNSYDSMWKTTMEMTQVTEVQAQQFKEVYTDLIAGRNQDQNLLFKMVKEDNPKLDTAVYTQLQREIAANRKVFANNQDKITDVIREYNTYLSSHPITGSFTGRTKLDATDYIVTSEETQSAFKSKKATAIDITGKK